MGTTLPNDKQRERTDGEETTQVSAQSKGEKLKHWLFLLQEKIPLINGTIAVYEELTKAEHKELWSVYECFGSVLAFNVVTTMTVSLACFFDGTKTRNKPISLSRLIDYCEDNVDGVFASLYGDGENINRVVLEKRKADFKSTLKSCRERLNDERNQSLIEELKKARDKVFAHYYQETYFGNEKLSSITVKQNQELVDLAATILNDIEWSSLRLATTDHYLSEGDFKQLLLRLESPVKG